MIKPTKRKAFNFLRSYFDVLNELKTDKDKLQFLESIINKQFLDQDPEGLSFVANLCYESQRHAIESSVKGWKRAEKSELFDTPSTPLETNPSTPLGTNPSTPPKEEKEEEEEKGKVEYTTPTYEDFKTYGLSKQPSLDLQGLKMKYESWIENGWKNGNDKPIKNWKSTLLNTIPYMKIKVKKFNSPI